MDSSPACAGLFFCGSQAPLRSLAGDPVQIGLVASMSRPGGNVTGATTLGVELASKRLELAHELVPTASVIAALINPANSSAEPQLRDLQAAARTLGVQLRVVHASSERDFDMVFANLAQLRPGALVIGIDGFFIGRNEQLATLAARHALPAIFQDHAFAAAGGLMSYGGSRTVRPAFTRAASSRARSRPTCRYRCRPSTS
jgi:ABC-type uncharacterized transport system substrate-binding protein